MQLEQGCNISCCNIFTTNRVTCCPQWGRKRQTHHLATVLGVQPWHHISEFNYIVSKEYTEYTHSHYIYSCGHAQGHKHLPVRCAGDRGIESVHIQRGTRACGDSGAVGASGGSWWCAAERNSFQSSFLTLMGKEHNYRAETNKNHFKHELLEIWVWAFLWKDY